jgi:GTPase SAR1 family protein
MRLLAVQPINIIIDDLQTTINSEIGSREQLQNLSALVSIQAFQEIATRLAKIRRILNIQRYNLVFIGQVGAGKTTAICHLLNLVQTVTVERTLHNGKKVTINKTQELLSTGAGKSTICEVVIRPAKFTYIEIDPYAAIELQQLIEEFGLWIWQKAHPATAKIRVEIPPDELLRAIRNIVELPEIIVNGKLQDCALGFASHFASDRYLEFKDELIGRGKLSARTATKIQPQTEDVDEKLWLSGIFQSLNVAKLNNFSIPKRIYLNLSAKILSFDHQRIGNIIDTRGLDLATKDRRDLAEYI